MESGVEQSALPFNAGVSAITTANAMDLNESFVSVAEAEIDQQQPEPELDLESEDQLPAVTFETSNHSR